MREQAAEIATLTTAWKQAQAALAARAPTAAPAQHNPAPAHAASQERQASQLSAKEVETLLTERDDLVAGVANAERSIQALKANCAKHAIDAADARKAAQHAESERAQLAATAGKAQAAADAESEKLAGQLSTARQAAEQSAAERWKDAASLAAAELQRTQLADELATAEQQRTKLAAEHATAKALLNESDAERGRLQKELASVQASQSVARVDQAQLAALQKELASAQASERAGMAAHAKLTAELTGLRQKVGHSNAECEKLAAQLAAARNAAEASKAELVGARKAAEASEAELQALREAICGVAATAQRSVLAGRQGAVAQGAQPAAQRHAVPHAPVPNAMAAQGTAAGRAQGAAAPKVVAAQGPCAISPAIGRQDALAEGAQPAAQRHAVPQAPAAPGPNAVAAQRIAAARTQAAAEQLINLMQKPQGTAARRPRAVPPAAERAAGAATPQESAPAAAGTDGVAAGPRSHIPAGRAAADTHAAGPVAAHAPDVPSGTCAAMEDPDCAPSHAGEGDDSTAAPHDEHAAENQQRPAAGMATHTSSAEAQAPARPTPVAIDLLDWCTRPNAPAGAVATSTARNAPAAQAAGASMQPTVAYSGAAATNGARNATGVLFAAVCEKPPGHRRAGASATLAAATNAASRVPSVQTAATLTERGRGNFAAPPKINAHGGPGATTSGKPKGWRATGAAARLAVASAGVGKQTRAAAAKSLRTRTAAPRSSDVASSSKQTCGSSAKPRGRRSSAVTGAGAAGDGTQSERTTQVHSVASGASPKPKAQEARGGRKHSQRQQVSGATNGTAALGCECPAAGCSKRVQLGKQWCRHHHDVIECMWADSTGGKYVREAVRTLENYLRSAAAAGVEIGKVLPKVREIGERKLGNHCASSDEAAEYFKKVWGSLCEE